MWHRADCHNSHDVSEIPAASIISLEIPVHFYQNRRRHIPWDMYIPCIGPMGSTRSAELFSGQTNLSLFINPYPAKVENMVSS